VTQWLKRTGRAVGLALAWAVVWAPIAVVIGTTIVDPDNSMDEMWPAVGAYPGFLCALIFLALLGIAERGRRLDELSLARAGAWGALAGVIVGVFPLIVGTPTSSVPVWQLGLAMVGSIAVMSAVSGIASALVARMAKKRQLRDARPRIA
jgi:hypothetical protein